MEILKKIKYKWGAFGEWASIMTPLVILFLYIHHENTSLHERLDNHITAINQRCDLLHHEFIALIKEMRK